MIEYEDATAIRRSARLVHDSAGLNFSVLNFFVFAGLILVVLEIVILIFKGA